MGTALRINIETGVEELVEVSDVAPVVQYSVSRRQALLALDAAGILDDAEMGHDPGRSSGMQRPNLGEIVR